MHTRLQGKIALTLLSFCLSFSVIATPSGNASSMSLEDKNIRDSISAKIAKEKSLNHTKIRIKAKDGMVTITGFVADDYQEDLIFKLAESTEGVNDVTGSLEPTRDLLITARIEGLLIRNKLLDYPEKKGGNLKLSTDLGVVSIYGTALNKLEEDKITSIAKSVRGVVGVVSHLKLTQVELPFCPMKTEHMVNKQVSILPDKEA